MVEKPPLYTYDIYLEVEAHGGYGGIWRPFYLSYISTLLNENNIFFLTIGLLHNKLTSYLSSIHISFYL